MKLTQLKLYAIKLALYSGGLLYIATDLFLFQGPLWGMLHKDKEKLQEQQQTAAVSVYGIKVTKNQVQRSEAEATALADSVHPDRVLKDIICNTLLRIRTQYNNSHIPNYTHEAEEIVNQLSSRASSRENFEQQLQSQGYTTESFTHKMTAILRQLHYLDSVIEKKCNITDEAINAAMLSLGSALYVPTSREVRHIFFSTQHRTPDEAKAEANRILAELTQQTAPNDITSRFIEAAQQHSEDAATQHKGGNLGKLTTYPTPALPELNLFDESSTPTGTPILKQSKWGWHIILAGPPEKGHYANDTECRDSVRTAMLSYLRQQALQEWIESNMAEAVKKKRIITHGK